jgi:hypothetical protein
MDQYTGPYISDGKLQESVEFGMSKPDDIVDRASRLHDTAYAHFSDTEHRMAADAIYYETLRNVPGLKAAAARSAVMQGNQVLRGIRDAMQLAPLMTFGVPGMLAGLAYWEGKNILSAQDMIDNGRKYKRDVLELYMRDPLIDEPGFQKPIVYPSPDSFYRQEPKAGTPIMKVGDNFTVWPNTDDDRTIFQLRDWPPGRKTKEFKNKKSNKKNNKHKRKSMRLYNSVTGATLTKYS